MFHQCTGGAGPTGGRAGGPLRAQGKRRDQMRYGNRMMLGGCPLCNFLTMLGL